MDIFLHILLYNVIPLSLMIAVGVVMQRVFSLDIKTLSKLNFYVFAPAIIFKLLYETPITLEVFGKVAWFLLLFMAGQYALVELIVRLRGHKEGMRGAFRNSVLFYNSANYGVPLNQLVFAGNPYTLSVQIIVMMAQTLIPNTYGIYSVNAHKAKWQEIRKVILSMPAIYAIPAAFLLRGFDIKLPEFIHTPVDYLASAFIGTALITLGVQLGSMKWTIRRQAVTDVGLSSATRLLIGPALAWLITILIGVDSLTAAALIVSSAVPTSLSSVLLAVEFDNEAEFASQAVFVSTVASIFTVTLVIFMLNV